MDAMRDDVRTATMQSACTPTYERLELRRDASTGEALKAHIRRRFLLDIVASAAHPDQLANGSTLTHAS